ncbi:hypothetical protein LMG667_19770 [Xanthomonas euvesicatoria]|uniref:hypothetical protein n=1 Tax=Xanthomonas euvesicatoria TaxID=456327 RepID=UPI00080E7951|nr:hypothetical protein [Xanthomonas euvesicatoria]OCG82135.1 hypothetical protein LMG667_19770 [Xanthomonas euvesicatoria]
MPEVPLGLISIAELSVLTHMLDSRRGNLTGVFLTGAGSPDFDPCLDLTTRGLLTRHRPNALSGGSEIFRITDAGRAATAAHAKSTVPTPLTRSQRRYRAWLSSNSPLSFGQWLRRGTRPAGAL